MSQILTSIAFQSSKVFILSSILGAGSSIGWAASWLRGVVSPPTPLCARWLEIEFTPYLSILSESGISGTVHSSPFSESSMICFFVSLRSVPSLTIFRTALTTSLATLRQYLHFIELTLCSQLSHRSLTFVLLSWGWVACRNFSFPQSYVTWDYTLDFWTYQYFEGQL